MARVYARRNCDAHGGKPFSHFRVVLPEQHILEAPSFSSLIGALSNLLQNVGRDSFVTSDDDEIALLVEGRLFSVVCRHIDLDSLVRETVSQVLDPVQGVAPKDDGPRSIMEAQFRVDGGLHEVQVGAGHDDPEWDFGNEHAVHVTLAVPPLPLLDQVRQVKGNHLLGKDTEAHGCNQILVAHCGGPSKGGERAWHELGRGLIQLRRAATGKLAGLHGMVGSKNVLSQIVFEMVGHVQSGIPLVALVDHVQLFVRVLFLSSGGFFLLGRQFSPASTCGSGAVSNETHAQSA
mmetsp:Transcript_30757/g.89346  ORF Transcript_30757/g.89346 Transcript_30757/m.89346 type:complete len:291 (+) Transcript_30757:423-1295(+)